MLLDIIANAGGIGHNDIDDVDVHDAFSFAEVPTDAVDQIIYSFATTKIKGKIIGVEIAKDKKSSSSKSRSSRGGRSKSKEDFKPTRRTKDGFIEIDMRGYNSSKKRRR